MISQREEQATHVRIPTPLSKDGMLAKLVLDRGTYVWVLGKPSQMPDCALKISNADYFGYCVFSVPEQYCDFVNGVRFRPADDKSVGEKK